jgi:hypothetical protein
MVPKLHEGLRITGKRPRDEARHFSLEPSLLILSLELLG